MAKQKKKQNLKKKKNEVKKIKQPNKKKTAKKIPANAFVIIILIVLTIIFAGFKVVDLIKKPTDTIMIQEGKISLDENTEGYIVRKETIVENQNGQNNLKPIKNEGEKVAKGEEIFKYYNEAEDELKNNISEVNKKISEALETETKFSSTDIKAIEKQIENELEYLYKMNNLAEIEEYKKQMVSNMNKKSKIAGESNQASAQLKQLIKQRDDYEKQLVAQNKAVTAPLSGMVSYRIDGLEGTLLPDDFTKLNKGFLENLNIKASYIIPPGNETAKITSNFEAYIIVVSNSSEAKNTKVGKRVNLRLNNTEEIPAIIEHINEEDDCRVIIFKINNKLDELTKYRKIKLDIVWWSENGLKVPNTAILQEDDKNAVIRNRAGYLDKIIVNVLERNETYSIIKNYTTEELKEFGHTIEEIKAAKKISIYDEIITNPTLDMIK